jgi:bacterioferritin-associated ferredoxin
MKGCLMYVCICEAVTDDQIRFAVTCGARTIEDVGEACAAGTGCGSCHDEIDVFLLAVKRSSGLAA